MAAMTQIVMSEEVLDAMSKGIGIVALESTIISHGLPWPQNKEVALQLHQIVREEGGVPATIAIIGGKIKVGLSEEDIDALAKPENKVVKVSRRDIAYVLTTGQTGATTVSATSFIAAKCGIHLFATGGIGGVHRDGQNTLDISADLTELGRTHITVVSAGIKSILDIGRTLEFLETQGVTVVGYQTDEFPSFFSVKSGFKSPLRLDTPQQCASLIHNNLSLGLGSGILVAVPIPEELAVEGEMVEKAIQQAISEQNEKGISGNEITPFLLKRLVELTGGKSLSSNLSLIRNNTKVATKIAVELSKINSLSQTKH